MIGTEQNVSFLMEKKVIFNDLGEMEYAKAWDYQRNLHSQILELKRVNEELPVCEQTSNYNYLLFCEHPHVYTLGKSGDFSNLLLSEKQLEAKGGLPGTAGNAESTTKVYNQMKFEPYLLQQVYLHPFFLV